MVGVSFFSLSLSLIFSETKHGYIVLVYACECKHTVFRWFIVNIFFGKIFVTGVRNLLWGWWDQSTVDEMSS